MIKISHLVKNYGSFCAVDDISFEVERGEVVGFLGPNGAGKSTTMNIVTGYLSSTSGSVTIGGVDILDDPLNAKRLIGYLPEQPPLYPDMTVDEYLSFCYDLKGCTLNKQKHIEEVCSVVKIGDVRRRLIKNLSKGYRQRVGIAQALIGNPPVIIFDEPTIGLDPKQIIEIRTLIKKLGRNHTVILSSHILSEVQAVCDKIVVIDKGKLVANDTTEHLSHNLSADHKLTVQIEGPTKEVKALLEQIPEMQEVHLNRTIDKTIGEYELNAIEGCDIRREVFKRMAARNYPILLMRSSELTLEEIFLKLTTGDFYGNTDNGGARK